MLELSEWLARRATVAARARIAAVMYACVRKDVVAAVDQGYNLYAIWSWLHNEGRFTASYQTFCRYVRRDHQGARRNKPVPQRRTSPTPLSATTMPLPPKPKPAATPQDGIGGFHMRPMSKEELF